MKTRKKFFLALTVCAFGAAYTGVLTLPVPAQVTVAYYCPPSYQTCYIPGPNIAQLMP
ncbi:hypothetical protein NVV94_12960 [Pseudomonas sp. LS1212]|uniref:hypothetical protein n=1 Tax=Pseudomonas sp. LS1212 TaxID=2972478 RepID=UPI00215CED9B|nr:hypothetical protein [Pseudomonas sp. LS1212]UVJ46355.1 hypothetical protein NVV94_12960 [Pseudomonas sp. LS1212]